VLVKRMMLAIQRRAHIAPRRRYPQTIVRVNAIGRLDEGG